MVELLALLVCSSATEIPEDAQRPPTQLPGPVFTLNTIDQELLLGKVSVNLLLY